MDYKPDVFQLLLPIPNYFKCFFKITFSYLLTIYRSLADIFTDSHLQRGVQMLQLTQYEDVFFFFPSNYKGLSSLN